MILKDYSESQEVIPMSSRNQEVIPYSLPKRGMEIAKDSRRVTNPSLKKHVYKRTMHMKPKGLRSHPNLAGVGNEIDT